MDIHLTDANVSVSCAAKLNDFDKSEYDGSRQKPSSDILKVVGGSQQWLHLDGLVVFEVGPEKVQPVASLRLDESEKVALEKVDEILESAAVKRTFPTFRDKMSISKKTINESRTPNRE